jgi:hypothetical protein
MKKSNAPCQLFYFFLSFCVIVLTTVLFTRICLSDEVSFNKAKSDIETFSVIHGASPTEKDYFDIIFKKGMSLSVQEQGKLYGLILSLQHPVVDKTSLLKIIKSKVNSINYFKSHYAVSVFSGDFSIKNNSPKYSYDCVYAFSREKLFFERIGKSSDGDDNHIVYAYDGDIFQTVVNPNNVIPNVTIDELTSYDFFFQPCMPFFAAMMFDMTLFPSGKYLYDLISFLEDPSSKIFEKTIQCNGYNCIAVANSSTRILLCPEKDYSLIQFEVFRFDYDSNVNNSLVPIHRSLLVRRLLTNLQNYGNGVWLPSKIETYEYFDNVEPSKFTVLVKEIEINKEIKEDFFTDVIPENAFVNDGIRKMTYMQSDSPSIDSLLKKTVKSKRILIFRYISIIFGLLLIFIALAMKYRQYLKNKWERENRTEKIK